MNLHVTIDTKIICTMRVLYILLSFSSSGMFAINFRLVLVIVHPCPFSIYSSLGSWLGSSSYSSCFSCSSRRR